MAFQLEFVRNGDRTLWHGAVDKERDAYMRTRSGDSRESLVNYELNYKNHIIHIQADRYGQTRNKETGEVIERFELGKPRPPVLYVSVVKIRFIGKPVACALSKEETESLVIEALEAIGDGSLRKETNGGADVSFFPDYKFVIVEDNVKKAKSPAEARQELAEELARGTTGRG